MSYQAYLANNQYGNTEGWMDTAHSYSPPITKWWGT